MRTTYDYLIMTDKILLFGIGENHLKIQVYIPFYSNAGLQDPISDSHIKQLVTLGGVGGGC